MGFIWFWIVAVMIVAYVVFDGFDIGVGILHLFVARSEPERQISVRSIGPVWDGNEVWLLAAGGTLYFALPSSLCLSLQRILFGADDCALVVDHARARRRTENAPGKSRVADFFRWNVFYLEPAIGDILWRRLS
jgi:hypothetical protein